MSYTKQINNLTALTEVLGMALEVQNKGLATVFTRVFGHTLTASIDFYAPEWKTGTNADLTININVDQPESIEKAKAELQAFILALPEVISNKEAQVLDEKRKQFEILKAELAA